MPGMQRRRHRGGDRPGGARDSRGAHRRAGGRLLQRRIGARQEYWRRVREICDRHEVLLVADEILTGAGRTGTWSALEPYGVVPDIMVLGKGIAGGYAPLSAVVAPRRIVDVLAQGSGVFLHAQTFSHHATLCAAGVATIKYLRDHRLIERCAAMGAVLHRRLQSLRALPCVGDVRGRGLLAGIEFVEDKATRRPFPPAARFAESFAAQHWTWA